MRTHLATAVVLLFFAAPAWACSCGVFGSNPPCQAAWNASADFTGTVVDITQPSPVPVPNVSTDRTGRRSVNDPPVAFVSPKKIIRIKVGEALRGVNGQKEVEIVTGNGGGDCG